MKIGVLICVLALVVSATPAAVETATFESATRIGEGQQRTFFLFSTAASQYIIRHDGMGEVTANGRRRVFYLKASPARRIEQVFFHEYQGDLLLLYEVREGKDGTGYLARMNQQTRKIHWLTPIKVNDIGTCRIEVDAAHCGPDNNGTKINLTTGAQALN